jgi:8-oxo-dGTP diphosphatase
MIPRVGAPVDPRRRYTLRAGAYVILPRGGSVLLTVQTEDAPDVQLPGGGLDAGESPCAALHREVYEETGWTMAHPRRLGAFRRFTFMPEYDLWAEKLCTVYVARPALRLSDPIEPNHHTLWLPIAEAIDTLGNAGDRMMLARFARVYRPA